MKLKNRIIYLFILLFIGCSLFSSSYALKTGTVYLESNKETLEKDDEIEISVNLKEYKNSSF